MDRVYNFSAGPATLPIEVLQEVGEEWLDFQGLGMSVVEISHRSQAYKALNAEVEARFKSLLGLGDGYRVLFLQGGATTQFGMIPLNFLPDGGSADYVLTGNWSVKAQEDADRIGQTRVAASSAEAFRYIPPASEQSYDPDAAYVHITSNNTIYGTQFHEWPSVGDRPLVADMSSDILCRPIPAEDFALIYAGAQKNIGPAGATIVVIRESWLEKRVDRNLPVMFDYRTHIKKDSAYNTPPVFTIYMINLVLKWIEGLGGLAAMAQRNQKKAATVYEAIDRSGGFYSGYVRPEDRSLMNVTFTLPDDEVTAKFIAEAGKEGLVNLKGYRSLGGIRA